MSREEAISHLGTIARSGTAEFFKKLSGDQQKDSQLIGQFGVGFYSAFIVADRVERADAPRRPAGRRGRALGIEPRTATSPSRPWSAPSVARTVVLHLRRTRRNSSTPGTCASLVRRYSDHIAFPVRMPKEGEATLEYEAVNRGTALWARPKSDIKDDEYVEFYRTLTHDSGEPLAWAHNRVEGKRDYTSLIYIPAEAPFDLWQRDGARGLKLYVRRVFIMDDAEQFLPLYLRFVKGVLDSADLPLNVSRELLQADSEVEAMRGALTRRVLDMLAKLAKDEPEKYQDVLARIRRGAQGRPGRGLRQSRQADAAAAIRLARMPAARPRTVSLADYVARMQTGQDKIYFVVGESLAAARSHPAIEALRARNVEVLLLGRRIDAWVMDHLQDFEGKKLRDATRGDLELGSLASAAEKEKVEAQLKESKSLLKRVKDSLGDRCRGGAREHAPQGFGRGAGRRRARHVGAAATRARSGRAESSAVASRCSSSTWTITW